MDFYVISYDIPDDKRRNKVSDLLQDYGQPVQRSVFEVWLDPAMRRELIQRLETLVHHEEDSVRLYALCAACRQKIQTMGVGERPRPPGPIVI